MGLVSEISWAASSQAAGWSPPGPAAWVWWLAAPLVIPVLAALVMWWRARPRRPATMPESIAGHRSYLQALGAAVDSSGRERSDDR